MNGSRSSGGESLAHVGCLATGAGWLIWSPANLQSSPSLNATLVVSPSILFETIGTILIVYWIALWMFGLVRPEPTVDRTQRDAKD